MAQKKSSQGSPRSSNAGSPTSQRASSTRTASTDGPAPPDRDGGGPYGFFGGEDNARASMLDWILPMQNLGGQYIAGKDRKYGQDTQRYGTGMAESVLGGMGDAYSRYTANAEGFLANSPKVDLSVHGGQVWGLIKKSLRDDKLAGQNINKSYNDAVNAVGAGVNQANAYSGSLLDQYLGAAGQVEGLGQEAFEGAVGDYNTALNERVSGYDQYLGGYQKLARQDMPGMDVYRDQVNSGTANSVSQLRNMGAGSGSSIATLLSGQQQNLQNLAAQSAQYKAQRQQDLAEAQRVRGEGVGGAYDTRAGNIAGATGQQISNIGQASNMRAAGYGTGIDTAFGGANMRMELGQFGADAASSRYGVNNAATAQLSGLVDQGAGLNKYQYEMNSYNPWQANVEYNAGMAMNTMPYQSALDFYGDLIGLGHAKEQSANSMYTSQHSEGQNNIMSIFKMIGGGGMGG